MRDDNLTTFGDEDARGGFIDVLEEDLLDTAGEHTDAATRCSGGGNTGWKTTEQVGRNSREKRFHCGHAPGEKP